MVSNIFFASFCYCYNAKDTGNCSMEAHCICQKIKVKVVIFITVKLFAGKPLVTKPNTFADQVHHFMATTLPDSSASASPQRNSAPEQTTKKQLRNCSIFQLSSSFRRSNWSGWIVESCRGQCHVLARVSARKPKE